MLQREMVLPYEATAGTRPGVSKRESGVTRVVDG